MIFSVFRPRLMQLRGSTYPGVPGILRVFFRLSAGLFAGDVEDVRRRKAKKRSAALPSCRPGRRVNKKSLPPSVMLGNRLVRLLAALNIYQETPAALPAKADPVFDDGGLPDGKELLPAVRAIHPSILDHLSLPPF